MASSKEHHTCPISGLTDIPEWAGTNIYLKSLPVADYAHELYPQEQVFIEQAVPIRRNTFSSGRRCARYLMEEAGLPGEALVRRSDGSVDWPQGLIGSLSHTNDWAVAAIAVAAVCDAQLLGIDLERIKPMESGVLKLIAHGAEIEELSANTSPLWHATALFSMKESIYKCLAADYGRFIDFHDVEITDTASGRPSLQFKNSALAGLYPVQRLELRMAVTPMHVFTLVWLRGS